MDKEETVKRLQQGVSEFLKNKHICINGVAIYPKEIEIYYYKKGEYEDNSVHRNELQKNRRHTLYVHRWGKTKEDAYKGGNYPGVDLVVSDDGNHYTYLLRSVAFKEEAPVVGPNKVLKAICERICKPNDDIIEMYRELELLQYDIVSDESHDMEVAFSKRINLGKKVDGEYREDMLRAVVIDKYFRTTKCPKKEEMITELVLNKLSRKEISKEEAVAFSKEKLGYIPSTIKEY